MFLRRLFESFGCQGRRMIVGYKQTKSDDDDEDDDDVDGDDDEDDDE